MEANNQASIQTAPSELKGSIASRIVAIVVAALVFGALVYISRFAPKIFGMQITYPAAGIAPAFGIWFQWWGALGLVLGVNISQLPAGMNPLVWIPANLSQVITAMLPALLYRKDTVDNFKDWFRFSGICLLTVMIQLLVVLWNISMNGMVDFSLGLKTLYPVQILGNIIWMITLGPILLNVVSPYIRKAGLKFKGMFKD
jgi:hypothetical protein